MPDTKYLQKVLAHLCSRVGNLTRRGIDVPNFTNPQTHFKAEIHEIQDFKNEGSLSQRQANALHIVFISTFDWIYFKIAIASCNTTPICWCAHKTF